MLSRVETMLAYHHLLWFQYIWMLKLINCSCLMKRRGSHIWKLWADVLHMIPLRHPWCGVYQWIDFILVVMPLFLERQCPMRSMVVCMLVLSWWILTRKNTWIFPGPQFEGGWKVLYMIKNCIVPRTTKIQGSRIPLQLSVLYHTIDIRCEMADSHHFPFAWAHRINSMDSFQVTFHHRPATLMIYIFRRACWVFRHTHRCALRVKSKQNVNLCLPLDYRNRLKWREGIRFTLSSSLPSRSFLLSSSVHSFLSFSVKYWSRIVCQVDLTWLQRIPSSSYRTWCCSELATQLSGGSYYLSYLCHIVSKLHG